MKILLHILIKDLRHHLLEIAGFILVTAGWAWQQAHPEPWIQAHASQVFPILIFVLWFILIIRVVQGESLVGDREFWQTRPYCWWQLMLAKAILLIVCINGVFCLAQLYLLMDAGIPFRLSWIAGLLWLHLQYDVYFTLPAVAFAAITPSIVQWVLTFIGIGVGYFVFSWLPWSRLPITLTGTENLTTVLGVITIAGILLVVVVWQYARRHLWRSRIIAAVAVILAPLWFVFASTTFARDCSYPKSSADPLHLAINNDGGPHYTRVRAVISSTIYVPVQAVGLSPDSIAVVEGIRVHLSGDGGWRWDSPWMNQAITFSPTSKQQDVSLGLEDEMADALQTRHATASLELALALYHLDLVQTVQTGDERFTIPGVGFCHWLNQGSVACAAAFREPDVMVIRIESGSTTCGDQLPPGHLATQMRFDESPFPADFDISPLKQSGLDYGFAWDPPIPNPRNPKQNESASWCRGTPLTLRTGSLTRRMQITSALGTLGKETEKVESNQLPIVSFSPMYK